VGALDAAFSVDGAGHGGCCRIARGWDRRSVLAVCHIERQSGRKRREDRSLEFDRLGLDALFCFVVDSKSGMRRLTKGQGKAGESETGKTVDQRMLLEKGKRDANLETLDIL